MGGRRRAEKGKATKKKIVTVLFFFELAGKQSALYTFGEAGRGTGIVWGNKI